MSGGYFAGYEVRPKQVVLSVPMTYLGITGIYFPFTAEANVNVNIPAYELPATMAHEMAHAKGVSQEGEANLTSYVLCLRSENDYLQYSGLMNAAAALVNALPEERSSALREKFAPEVLQEYANASAHYAKYDSFLDEPVPEIQRRGERHAQLQPDDARARRPLLRTFRLNGGKERAPQKHFFPPCPPEPKRFGRFFIGGENAANVCG